MNAPIGGRGNNGKKYLEPKTNWGSWLSDQTGGIYKLRGSRAWFGLGHDKMWQKAKFTGSVELTMFCFAVWSGALIALYFSLMTQGEKKFDFRSWWPKTAHLVVSNGAKNAQNALKKK